MEDLRLVRIFISSPNDVRPERALAERIIRRLAREFSYHLKVEAVLWEREPLLASHHPQELIASPREMDIVVVLLWSKLGMPLPAEPRWTGPLSGGRVTGTEWEFEDALAGNREEREPRRPDLLMYRKRTRTVPESDQREAVEEWLRQKELVEDFMKKWFRDAEGKSAVAASWGFTDGAAFEAMLEEHLRALLRQKVIHTGGQDVRTIRWHQGSPYRGLEVFEPEHEQVFFGRTKARNELRELLARQANGGNAFVLVIGASGSGKSSLVRAGLLPELREAGMVGRVALVRYAITHPGATGDALSGLAAALMAPTALPELSELDHSPEELTSLLAKVPEETKNPIQRGLKAASKAAKLTTQGEARLLLVVDQLEELFTTEAITPEARDRYVAALGALAASGLVWVVATMRSDFFDRLERLPQLANLAGGEAKYLLKAPDGAEIGQIIRQPALEAGLEFEIDEKTGKPLDEAIREAAAGDSGSLPLLEYLLDQLWQRRTEQGQLTYTAYRDLGGLEGAIGQRAEEVLATLPSEVQAALPRVLRALVTVRPGARGAVTARYAPVDQFKKESAERRLIEALVDPGARLLVADGRVVRVAHEALLTHWKRARDQIAEDRADLQLRARLEEQAARWQIAATEDRDSLLLAAGLPLSEAEDLLKRRHGELDQLLVRYVEASGSVVRARQRRTTRRLQAVAAVLAVLAIGAAIGAWFGFTGQQHAQQQAAIATEQTRLAKAEGEKAERERRQADEARRTAERQEAEAKRQEAEAKRQETEAKRQGEEAQRQARIATEERERAQSAQSVFLSTIARREADNGDGRKSLRIALEALPRDVSAPDRPLVPQAVNALVYALEKNREIGALRGHGTQPVVIAAFSPDGKRIVTTSVDKTAKLWDPATGLALKGLAGHTDAVTGAAFDPSGKLLVTTGDPVIRLWEVESGTLVGTLEGHTKPVRSAVFSADGRLLLTGSWDNTARLWDVQSRKAIAVLQGSVCCDRNDVRNSIYLNAISRAVTTSSWRIFGFSEHVAISPDGRLAVTAGYVDDEAAPRVWSVPEGRLVTRLKGHNVELGFQFHAVAFDSTGRRIVTASGDRTARVWDAFSGTEVAVLRGHDGAVKAARFSTDGRRVVTGSADGTARVWDVETGAQLAVMRGHEDEIGVAVFDPSGGSILTASRDSTARIWDAASGRLLAVLRGHRGYVFTASFGPDGKTILTSAQDGTARLWRAHVDRTPIAIPAPPDDLRLTEDPPWALGFTADLRRAVAVRRTSPSGANEQSILVDPRSSRQVAVLEGNQPTFGHAGRWIATTLSGGTDRLWNTTDGRLVDTLPGRIVAQAPDGGRLLVSSTGGATLVDSGNGQAIAVVSPSAADLGLFAPTGRRLVIATGNDVQLADGISGASISPLRGHTSRVVRLLASPDGDWLATFSEDGDARLWRLADGAAMGPLVPEGAARAEQLAISDDGKFLLVGFRDQSALLWDLAKNHLAGRIEALRAPDGTPKPALATVQRPDGSRHGPVLEVLHRADEQFALPSKHWTARANPFLPDGHRLLRVDGRIIGPDHSTAEVKAPRLEALESKHQQRPTLLGESGRMLVEATTGVVLVDTGTGSVVAVLQDARPQSLASSPDHTRIAALTGDNEISVWDAASGQLLARATDEAGFRHLTFAPEGHALLVVLTSGEFRIYRADDNKLALQSAARGALAPDSHPSAARSIAAGRDRTGAVRVWDLRSGQQKFVLRAPRSLLDPELSEDGQRLLARDEAGTTHLWDLETGQEVTAFTASQGQYLRFDGDWVATSDRLALWSARTGPALDLSRLSFEATTRRAFSRDKSRLFMVGRDGKIHVLDSRSGVELGALTIPGLGDATRAGGTATTRRNSYDKPEVPEASFDDKLQSVGFLPTEKPDSIIVYGSIGAFLVDGLANRVVDLVPARRVTDVRMAQRDETAVVVVMPQDGPPILWRLHAIDAGPRTLDGGIARDWSTAFSSSANLVAIQGRDQTLRVWSTVTGGLVAELPNGGQPLTFGRTPDGSDMLHAIEPQRGVLVWNIQSARQIAGITVADPDRSGPDLTHVTMYAATGGLLVGSTYSALGVWDATTGEMLVRLADSGTTEEVIVSGRRVIAESEDGSIWLWSGVKEHQFARLAAPSRSRETRIRRDSAPQSLLIDDGRRLVTLTSEGARLFDTSSGKLISTLGNDSSICGIAGTSSGDIVGTITKAGLVKFWRANDGEPQGQLAAPAGPSEDRKYFGDSGNLARLQFTIDGVRVVSWGSSRTRLSGTIGEARTGRQLTSGVLAASPRGQSPRRLLHASNGET